MFQRKALGLEEVVRAIQDSCGSDVESVATLDYMISSGRLVFRGSGHPPVMPCARRRRHTAPAQRSFTESTVNR
jgi:hypothetical protein